MRLSLFRAAVKPLLLGVCAFSLGNILLKLMKKAVSISPPNAAIYSVKTSICMSFPTPAFRCGLRQLPRPDLGRI